MTLEEQARARNLQANSGIISRYKEIACEMISRNFPNLTRGEVEGAVNQAITNSIKDTPAKIENDYRKSTIDGSLLNLTDWMMDNRAILTSYGVMFKPHTGFNPEFDLVNGFIRNRAKLKAKMFENMENPELYARYELAQLLEKQNANAFYGAIGQYSCIFYNLNIAATITKSGRSANATASLFFESFLANNVPFGSLNELIGFIYNTIHEPKTIVDESVLDQPIEIQDCFGKLMSTAGFGWVPTEHEMEIVWGILTTCSQRNLNRLYYKNNLFEFLKNGRVMSYIIFMLQKLEQPFMDPNDPPEIIKGELNEFYNLLYEFVYYKSHIIDRLDKMGSLVRKVSIIQDTDSSIISLDAYYHFVLQYCIGIPMKIKTQEGDLEKYLDGNENFTKETSKPISDYDFIDDEIIERERDMDPLIIIPQDGLRYSIVNIMSYCITNLVNDYMVRYTKNNNSYNDLYPCFLVLKNEFLFKRVLLATEAKKHYAYIVELREGHVVPENKRLDFKGMEAFVKTSTAEEVRERLKVILRDDILNPEYVDQIQVIKDIAILEKDIYDSIMRGEKKFYKPVKIRSQSGYENPMRIQGVKAAYAYNHLKEDFREGIDLTIRNSIDIAKVFIHHTNVDRIKDTFPTVYEKALALLQTPDFSKKGIDAIAIPINEPVPEWILPFIRFEEIINDAVSKFPLESIGLYRGGSNNNYSNMVQI